MARPSEPRRQFAPLGLQGDKGPCPSPSDKKGEVITVIITPYYNYYLHLGGFKLPFKMPQPVNKR